jgi:hypothetical protein
MSKKKIKTEFIVLGMIIVVLALLLILNNKNSVHYKLPEIESMTLKDIEKIEINKVETGITLLRDNDKFVIYPQNYATDTSKIESILGAVANFKLITLISKTGDYERYGLKDDHKIVVKVYKKGASTIANEFEIGNTASTHGQTFVKIKGDKKVYHAMGSFRNHFDVKMDELRDKVVMKFDKNEITEININKEKQAFHFAKNIETPPAPVMIKKEGEKELPKPKEEVAWVSKNGKKVDQSQLDSLIDQMTLLKCDEYVEGKKNEDYKEPIFSVYLKGAKDYSLSIFKKLEDKEGKYPAISSESPYPFLLPSYKVDNIINKTKDMGDKK